MLAVSLKCLWNNSRSYTAVISARPVDKNGFEWKAIPVYENTDVDEMFNRCSDWCGETCGENGLALCAIPLSVVGGKLDKLYISRDMIWNSVYSALVLVTASERDVIKAAIAGLGIIK